MSYIRLKSVSVSYDLRNTNKSTNGKITRRFFALDSLNCEINDGDRVAVLGAAWSGKTSFLKVVSGILPPTKGTLHVNGKVNAELTKNHTMLGELSISDNIRLAAYYRGLKASQVDVYLNELLLSSGLDNFRNQPLKVLSAGMKRALTTSLLFADSAQVVVFDEWVNALTKVSEDGVDVFRDVIDRSDILIFATHKLPLVQKYCNRVIVLQDGVIVEDGPLEKVLPLYKAQLDPNELVEDSEDSDDEGL